jgi:CheY-like chemotaxis protein/nitrogen-specific signal transduction histidine kinase
VSLVLRLVALQRSQVRLAAEKLAAERANELKSQFMSYMTHELRTPLAAILGFNEKLAESRHDPDEHARCVAIVDKNSRHLLTLINNLLDEAKLSAGQLRINFAPVTLRHLMDDVTTTLAPQVEKKQLELVVNIGSETPPVLDLDELRVKQVLFNLLSNAIKFTERGGVTVTLEWRDALLSIAVTDTGPGMSPTQMERIFTPFQQAHERVVQKFGGTGLGLAISRRLCVLMGGDLTVQSVVGLGSTFTATFRATPSVRTEREVAQTETTVALAAPESLRVLVADDAEEIRMLVEYYLVQAGAEVLLAEDGAQAVEIALRERPDLVLTDLEMPELNGIEVIRTLRSKGYDHVLVLLTAHPEGSETDLAIEAGCNAFLAKPVNRKLLQETVVRLVADDRTGRVSAAP